MPKPRKAPLRKCVGCQEMYDKRMLLRVVHTPAGEVLWDPTGKQNGRGAYLCRNPECLQLARKKKSLERALKLTMPDEVYQRLAMQVEGRDG